MNLYQPFIITDFYSSDMEPSLLDTGLLSTIIQTMKWLYRDSVLFLAAWFLNIQLAADYEYYDGVKDAGVPGYKEDPFVQSEIVQFLEK